MREGGALLKKNSIGEKGEKTGEGKPQPTGKEASLITGWPGEAGNMSDERPAKKKRSGVGRILNMEDSSRRQLFFRAVSWASGEEDLRPKMGKKNRGRDGGREAGGVSAAS